MEVTEIALKWAKKSIKDPDLPWESAMDNVAKELGLNRAEFYTLLYARDSFKNLGYGLGIYEHLRKVKFEFEEIRKARGWNKKKKKKVKERAC